jgi:RNA polymerase subunit RPABC4/transcription elongation factor Spt4
MKLFKCQVCGNILYFENRTCGRCGGEDFAETWAHYLHIVDTLEMVAASGMSVRPIADRVGDHSASVDFDPYFASSIELLIEAWLPFVFAINSVSRAMGEPRPLSLCHCTPVVKKLGFVHDLTIRSNITIIRLRSEELVRRCRPADHRAPCCPGWPRRLGPRSVDPERADQPADHLVLIVPTPASRLPKAPVSKRSPTSRTPRVE